MLGSSRSSSQDQPRAAEEEEEDEAGAGRLMSLVPGVVEEVAPGGVGDRVCLDLIQLLQVGSTHMHA